MIKKTDLDLDFSDISAGVEKSPPQTESPKEEAPKIEKPKEPTLTGVKLNVTEDGNVVEMDLALCNNEQFIGWCESAYPGLQLAHKDVDGLTNKINMFKKIVSYGAVELFSRKRKERLVH